MMDEPDKISETVLTANEAIDLFEEKMLDNFPVVACPLTHRFTPGIYIRQIFMPQGSLVTSKIHTTTHPYNISQGDVSVWTDDGGEVRMQAPFLGITHPGTRRVLYNHEETVWTTFHPIPFVTGEEEMWPDEEKEKLVGIIEEMILDPYVNPLIGRRYWDEIAEIKQKELIEKEETLCRM